MITLGQAFNNLIYDNVLFKRVLPALHIPSFPMLQTITSSEIGISVFPYISLVMSTALVLGLLFLVRLVFQIKRSLSEPSVLLEITPPAFAEKTAYTTAQLFSVIHDLGKKRTFLDKLLGKKIIFSFEIVSSLDKGIRYLIRTSPEQVNNVKRTVMSYLLQVNVNVVDEYLPEWKRLSPKHTKVVEYKLTKHFAFPLQKQNVLDEHDPVAYITGMMTKLAPGELISFQIVIASKKVNEVGKLSQMVLRNENVLGYLNKKESPLVLKPVFFVLSLVIKLVTKIGNALQWTISELFHPSSGSNALNTQEAQSLRLLQMALVKPARVLSSFEQQQVQSVQTKINQSLFETSIRVLAVMNDKNALLERGNGFLSSLAVYSVPQYQAFAAKSNLPSKLLNKIRWLSFNKRLLSLVFNSSPMLLSVSEVADLYHFPFAAITQTENIVKVHSKELPAPISLKQGKRLGVIFGENNFGGTSTTIGLTEEERKTHMYIIGRTGSGKTTLMFNMAKHDIQNGEGIAFIDPHGDVSEDLLSCIPEERAGDLVFLNPFDLAHPIGINLLELTPGLEGDAAELEKEVVAEGVVSLFRKVFSNQENANAHRIEYILRNTIHTAFTTEDPTLFTVYDLLNNPPYQQQVVAKLQDENLKNFWKFEFGRAGDYQIVKMTGGVTAKIGRFLFSPTAKRILEQKRSTINFNDILDGKILICNFSQGKLGEDTARLLGTTILTKLQQAALKRANIPQDKRRQFHLYVDEFQNFATQSFAKMLSEGRKYGLEVCIAEQSTSQQQDRSIVNIILSNVTTVVCFRSGNPIDEQLMLAQFAPYLQPGDIQNLPRYHFYIKISAIESEEPFSGVTIFNPVIKDSQKRERLIAASRNNWAITYVRKPNSEIKVVTQIKPKASSADVKARKRYGALPETRQA